MKLWIFGHSMCLPDGVEEKQGWPFLLSKKLACEYVNFAQAGADNFFIYHTFLEQYKNIAPNDLVVVGWSHPSRKSFVYDPDNPAHVAITPLGLTYQTETKTLFRSFNKHKGGWVWSSKPKNSSVGFYDFWFNNYYSKYEQQCNFEAYMDSVAHKVPCRYLPFYFSQESVDQIDRQNDNFMLEFIIQNQVAISKDNMHANAVGHRLWADHLYTQI